MKRSLSDRRLKLDVTGSANKTTAKIAGSKRRGMLFDLIFDNNDISDVLAGCWKAGTYTMAFFNGARTDGCTLYRVLTRLEFVGKKPFDPSTAEGKKMADALKKEREMAMWAQVRGGIPHPRLFAQPSNANPHTAALETFMHSMVPRTTFKLLNTRTLKDTLLMLGVDPGRSSIFTATGPISELEFRSIKDMCDFPVQAPGDEPRGVVLDPNPLNSGIVHTSADGTKRMYYFRRIYGGPEHPMEYRGKLLDIKLVRKRRIKFDKHETRDGKPGVKRSFEEEDDEPHEHPEYGSSDASMRGWRPPKKDGKKRRRKKKKPGTGATAKAKGRGQKDDDSGDDDDGDEGQDVPRYWTDDRCELERKSWLASFFPNERFWRALSIFPGEERYELIRELPRDTFRREAKIPQNTKKRQAWRDEPGQLPVRNEADLTVDLTSNATPPPTVRGVLRPGSRHL